MIFIFKYSFVLHIFKIRKSLFRCYRYSRFLKRTSLVLHTFLSNLKDYLNKCLRKGLFDKCWSIGIEFFCPVLWNLKIWWLKWFVRNCLELSQVKYPPITCSLWSMLIISTWTLERGYLLEKNYFLYIKKLTFLKWLLSYSLVFIDSRENYKYRQTFLIV